jgi:hypothetical protein
VQAVAKKLGYTAIPKGADDRGHMAWAIATYAMWRDAGSSEEDAKAAVEWAIAVGGEAGSDLNRKKLAERSVALVGTARE